MAGPGFPGTLFQSLGPHFLQGSHFHYFRLRDASAYQNGYIWFEENDTKSRAWLQLGLLPLSIGERVADNAGDGLPGDGIKWSSMDEFTE